MATAASHTLVTKPMLAENDRKDVAQALRSLATSFEQGHADAELQESAQLLVKKGVLADISSLMPLFVAGQHKAIKARDAAGTSTTTAAVSNDPLAVSSSKPAKK